MSRWPCNNRSSTQAYGFEQNRDGICRPIAVDFNTPATELEAAEEPEPKDILPYEQI